MWSLLNIEFSVKDESNLVSESRTLSQSTRHTVEILWQQEIVRIIFWFSAAAGDIFHGSHVSAAFVLEVRLENLGHEMTGLSHKAPICVSEIT